ncbi:MAG: hypothetical protein AAF985_24120 [Bacteroidota bacterium]
MLTKSNLLFLTFVFGISFTSHTKEITPTEFRIEHAEAIIQQFNLNKFDHQKGELIEGNVYIRTASRDRILVFVESESLKNDAIGYFNHYLQ